MLTILENDILKVSIDSFGAELKSIIKKETNTEYMWDADEKYWKRTSPVLFPIVGSLKNKEFSYDGFYYPMSQHGFARDMEFTLKEATDTTAWFYLVATKETLKKYPFKFRLELGYELTDNKLKVLWKVVNEDDKDMHFSIGGHPAFVCPLNNEGVQSDYYFEFDNKMDNIIYGILSENGLLSLENQPLETFGGRMKIAEGLFDMDALIIEHNQAQAVSILKPDKTPYLKVSFHSPLFGLWSPAKKHAPFVCIEPWYGRADHESFDGNLQEREYSNQLAPAEEFNADYEIEIMD